MVQNFTLIAVKPGSPFDRSPIAATQSSLWLKSHEQPATFQLKNDEIFLYADPAPSQKLYTDRSGMGQGVLQYTHDAAQAAQLNPNRIEQSGWAIRGDKLQLRGAGFLATPGGDGGSWRVWMDTGNKSPAGQQGGVEFEVGVVPVPHPVGKHYSNL